MKSNGVKLNCACQGLEGVDAVLEEGAANLEELKVIWGDPEEPLDFDGFCARLNTRSTLLPLCMVNLFDHAGVFS